MLMFNVLLCFWGFELWQLDITYALSNQHLTCFCVCVFFFGQAFLLVSFSHDVLYFPHDVLYFQYSLFSILCVLACLDIVCCSFAGVWWY